MKKKCTTQENTEEEKMFTRKKSYTLFGMRRIQDRH